MKYFSIIAIILLTSSCAFHSGMVTATQAPISNSKITYVDMAIGYSSVIYFFGIGGLKKDVLTNEAKRNLYLSYPLGPGQSFENITLDKKKTIFWPYEKVETVIVADVVERDSSYKIQYGKNYLDLQNKSNPHNQNFLKLNDEIIFFSFSDKENTQTLNGKVVKLKESSAMVFYIDGDGSFKIDNVNYNGLFKSNKLDSLQNEFGFKKGEVVTFSSLEANGKTSMIQGVVMGMNPKYALIQTSRGRKSVSLSQIKKS